MLVKARNILVTTLIFLSFFSFAQTLERQIPISESIGKAEGCGNAIKKLFKQKDKIVHEPNESGRIIRIKKEIASISTLKDTIITLVKEKIRQIHKNSELKNTKTDQEIPIAAKYDGQSASFWFSSLESKHFLLISAWMAVKRLSSKFVLIMMEIRNT